MYDWINTSHGPVNMAVIMLITATPDQRYGTTKHYVLHLGPGANLILDDEKDAIVLREWAGKRKVQLPSLLISTH